MYFLNLYTLSYNNQVLKHGNSQTLGKCICEAYEASEATFIQSFFF